MKIKLATIFLVLFVWCSYQAVSQVTFSVSPGFALNGAQLGYKVSDKFIPYVSLQYIQANTLTTETGRRINDQSTGTENFEDEYSVRGTLFIPSLGAKYFLKSSGKLRSFLQGAITKPIVSGKVEDNGDVDEQLEDDLKNLSIWGGELSFGVEYFFDPNFSLGGEFGLRGFHAKYTESSENTVSYFNNDTQQIEEAEITSEMETKVNLSPTFSRISLNFYF